MIDTIYIEEEVKDHFRTQKICNKFPEAHLVFCERYSEIFNCKSQSFREQKQKPSLILAKKYGAKVLRVPSGYTLGQPDNFYFSHMLNCMYDCRYCFLQGMYRSAHYVVFVNYEDFQEEIEKTLFECSSRATFFSGYDADSLNFEHVTHFLEFLLPFFKTHPKGELEVRTKSMNIRSLLKQPSLPNVIMAMSLNPQWVVSRFEHRTPRMHQRLKALRELQIHGWPIGLRFDPLIYHPGWKENYQELFDLVFTSLDPKQIHSTTLGPFRLPMTHYKRMQNQFPDEPLFTHEIESHKKMMSYRKEIEQEMFSFCKGEILQRVDPHYFFPSIF